MRLSPNAARASAIGIELSVTLLAFPGIGWWLDGKFGTAPWGLIVGCALGMFAAVRALMRVSKLVDEGTDTDD